MINHNLGPRFILNPTYMGDLELIRELFFTIPNNMPNVSCYGTCMQTGAIDRLNNTKIVIIALNRLQLYNNMSRKISPMVWWLFMNHTTFIFWVRRNSIRRCRITSINQQNQLSITQLHVSKVVLYRLFGTPLLYYLVTTIKYLLDKAIQFQKSFRSSFKIGSILF
ncbi:hypothetical protein YH69_31400 [Pseudomonas aeruginosa]|nr:hypothetical protein YH69_31400 [Pseudomonas aeruginosa]HBP5652429.1 hypothetical protein [Pseudomonas aeruginosa]HBP6756724.1 hypothetical protein [Pseudomonas aeruginosa]